MTKQVRSERRGRSDRARDNSMFPSLRRDLGRMFEDFIDVLPGVAQEKSDDTLTKFVPDVDVTETDGEIQVTAELPGMDEKDIRVEVEEECLILSGEKRDQDEEEEGDRYWREVSYGRFRRGIRLPADIDPERAQARFRNGVLRVTLPKSGEELARRRSVKVEASE